MSSLYKFWLIFQPFYFKMSIQYVPICTFRLGLLDRVINWANIQIFIERFNDVLPEGEMDILFLQEDKGSTTQTTTTTIWLWICFHTILGIWIKLKMIQSLLLIAFLYHIKKSNDCKTNGQRKMGNSFNWFYIWVWNLIIFGTIVFISIILGFCFVLYNLVGWHAWTCIP